MFYCHECQKNNDWPQSMSGSNGNCEVCGANGPCYDVPSSELPPARQDNSLKTEPRYSLLDLEKAYCIGFINQPGITVDELAFQSKHLREKVDLATKFIDELKLKEK